MDAAADLLLQGSCPGCHRPGRGVCRQCTNRIMAGEVGPRTRAGIDLPLWSAGTYADPLPEVISQAKDHQRWDAIELLGVRLSFAVAGLVDETGLRGPVVLVPFPSQAQAVRRRGLDFTTTLARSAARHLHRAGLAATAAPVLGFTRRVHDQGGLTSDDRSRNLNQSVAARHRLPPAPVILVDDVVTTGSSLREGVRALAAANREPTGLATIGATILRSQQNLAGRYLF